MDVAIPAGTLAALLEIGANALRIAEQADAQARASEAARIVSACVSQELPITSDTEGTS